MWRKNRTNSWDSNDCIWISAGMTGHLKIGKNWAQKSTFSRGNRSGGSKWGNMKNIDKFGLGEIMDKSIIKDFLTRLAFDWYFNAFFVSWRRLCFYPCYCLNEKHNDLDGSAGKSHLSCCLDIIDCVLDMILNPIYHLPLSELTT